VSDWNTQVIEEFRANDGKVGGNFEGAPLVLLHTTGAKSGQERVHPMMYLPDGERWIVFASAAGADKDPAWFLNLKAHPEVSIEVGTDSLPVLATELTGAERDRLYAEQARLFPGFKEYEEKTDRLIPVVALTRRTDPGSQVGAPTGR
jgi:deazaflavin-dependent oxidoreductase (nitroreductase family)